MPCTCVCPALPKHIPSLLPVQTTSTYQPFTEESQPMLNPPFLYYETPHDQSPQFVRPNLAPAIKRKKACTQLAACNTSERPRNSTNQVTHRTMTKIYAKQQKESWLQHQQQQCSEHNMLDFLNNIQPPIAHHSHQDAEEASGPLLYLLSSHDRVTTPLQTVSTAAHVQHQKGKQIIQCFQHVYFAFYSVILYLGNTHIYLLKMLCCIKYFITLKFMTETGRHAYKSLTKEKRKIINCCYIPQPKFLLSCTYMNFIFNSYFSKENMKRFNPHTLPLMAPIW